MLAKTATIDKAVRMSLSKRKRAFFDLVKSRGMNSSQAFTIALALHPIDKISRRASRSDAFRTEMLQRAEQFGRDSEGVPGNVAEKMALQALDNYCRIASNHDQQYYVQRFCSESNDRGAPDVPD